MEDSLLFSNLYINRINITKEIPEGNYLKDLPVIKSLKVMDGIQLHKKVTFIVGENGVGKSTLIEGIAVAMGFNPEGGTRNFNFSTKKTHSDLHQYLTISRGYKRQRDGIKAVDYKDTEHFAVTKRFMDAPEKMVEELLGE